MSDLHDRLVVGANRMALLPEVGGQQMFFRIQAHTKQGSLTADNGYELGPGHGAKVDTSDRSQYVGPEK